MNRFLMPLGVLRAGFRQRFSIVGVKNSSRRSREAQPALATFSSAVTTCCAVHPAGFCCRPRRARRLRQREVSKVQTLSAQRKGHVVRHLPRRAPDADTALPEAGRVRSSVLNWKDEDDSLAHARTGSRSSWAIPTPLIAQDKLGCESHQLGRSPPLPRPSSSMPNGVVQVPPGRRR